MIEGVKLQNYRDIRKNGVTLLSELIILIAAGSWRLAVSDWLLAVSNWQLVVYLNILVVSPPPPTRF